MNIRNHRGRLFYDETAYLDFQSFIVREGNIGFAAASVNPQYGRWEMESSRPAVLTEEGTYLAGGLHAQQQGVKTDGPWDISFRIEHEDMGATIEISGELAAEGNVYEFSGELDAIK